MRNQLLSSLPTEVEGIDALAELALDMRWPCRRRSAI